MGKKEMISQNLNFISYGYCDSMNKWDKKKQKQNMIREYETIRIRRRVRPFL